MPELDTLTPDTYEQHRALNRQSASILLFGKAFIAAVADRRLQRTHLRVLAAISLFMDHNIEAWPSRKTLAHVLDGLSLKTVSNTITELRQFGYLVTARKPIEKADGKTLTVYTFGNVDHDAIIREHGDLMTKYVYEYEKQYSSVAAISAGMQSEVAAQFPSRGELDTRSSPSEGNFAPEVPLPRGNPRQEHFPSRGVHAPPEGNSGQFSTASSPPEGRRIESSTLTVTQEDMFSPRPAAVAADARNITQGEQKKKKKTRERSQIDPNWIPTSDLVQWVSSQWDASEKQIRDEIEKFRDHYKSKAATMADWAATWRNWWRNGYHKIPLKPTAAPVSPTSEKETARQKFLNKLVAQHKEATDER